MKKESKHPDTSKPCVLAVDDIPRNLQLLGIILKSTDYRVAFATNGKDALKSVKKLNPDLILLDVMMPEMDGFEVIQKLKADEKYKDIPVIFVTGKSETDDMVKGFELGAADYVTKPFNKAELKARVKMHIDLKRNQDLLTAKNRELNELNEVKDRLFSVISHDLRSPFQGLMGLTEMMSTQADGFTKEEMSEYAGLIKTSADQIYDLLENLLEWSVLERQGGDFKPMEFNINKMLTETGHLFSLNAAQKNIEIKYELEATHRVKADINMIRSVIRNLLSNALKFTNENGLVTLRSRDGKNGKVCFSVADNGIGMTADYVKKLNGKERIESRSGTNSEKGTGLGLMLTKQHIEANDGVFEIHSEHKKGTEVVCRLPLGSKLSEREISENKVLNVA